MSTETETVSFDYEPVDVSEIPTRPRPVSPGRPSHNPHTDAVRKLAGTGECLGFKVPDPGTDDERTKLVARHTRYLRMAAHELDRGARVWATILADEGMIRINFQDRKYSRRTPATETAAPSENVATDVEGSHE